MTAAEIGGLEKPRTESTRFSSSGFSPARHKDKVSIHQEDHELKELSGGSKGNGMWGFGGSEWSICGASLASELRGSQAIQPPRTPA